MDGLTDSFFYFDGNADGGLFDPISYKFFFFFLKECVPWGRTTTWLKGISQEIQEHETVQAKGYHFTRIATCTRT